MSHEQASAVGVNFVVAWLGTINYAKLVEGETIVVVGVGGGVGGAVAQISKACGCRVIGVDRSELPALSPVSRLIDEYVPSDASLVEQIRERTHGGADVGYDTGGGVLFEQSLRMVKQRGRVVEISAVGKRRVEFDLIEFYRNETQLFGVDSAKRGVAESAVIMEALRDKFDGRLYQPPLIAQRGSPKRHESARLGARLGVLTQYSKSSIPAWTNPARPEQVENGILRSSVLQ